MRYWRLFAIMADILELMGDMTFYCWVRSHKVRDYG